MRIIGGSLRGRRLQAPAGSLVRPTSDRVRESIFNILGPPAPATRVLDAFAGAGTLGLEALSRGASEAVFIDRARAAIRCVRANIDALGLVDRARVLCADSPSLCERWHRRGPSTATPGQQAHQRFRWLFLDPPYRGDAAERMLSVLASGQLLTDDATVVVEHDRRNQPADRWGSLVQMDRRRYGDTEVSFYRLCGARQEGQEHVPSSQ